MQGVHVWRASLQRRADDLAMLHDLLDATERARAMRFRNDRDRHRFVAARGTLRILLGEYTNTPPHRVALRTLPGGKPVLARENESEGVRFNLSHCGDLAVFAFSDHAVGVDVERLTPGSDMSQVAAHFFSPDEVGTFRRLGASDRMRFFFRTWVRKEAYVKATGDGFAVDPSRVRVADSPAGDVTLLDEDGMRRLDDSYLVQDLADFDDHVAALAVSVCSEAPTIEYRDWGSEKDPREGPLHTDALRVFI